jgi:hypothetical protein
MPIASRRSPLCETNWELMLLPFAATGWTKSDASSGRGAYLEIPAGGGQDGAAGARGEPCFVWCRRFAVGDRCRGRAVMRDPGLAAAPNPPPPLMTSPAAQGEFGWWPAPRGSLCCPLSHLIAELLVGGTSYE